MSGNKNIAWGFELEFCSSLLPTIISTNLDVYFGSDNTKWTLAHDGTARGFGKMGYELRTPIFTEFPLHQLKEKLNKLIKLDASTHSRCGLHFHFSLQKGVHLNATQLEQQLRQMKMPRHQRQVYCNKKEGKYRPLRCVNADDLHYEIRIFNASLKLRAIHQNWKTCNKLVNLFIL